MTSLSRPSLTFGYVKHHQPKVLEATNPVYDTQTTCRFKLTPLNQPAGSYSCGTVALATVLNAMHPQQPPINSDDLDKSIRRWKSYGLAPQLLADEARRRGLFAETYNHGHPAAIEQHLKAGHVVVLLHRVRTQYHYELVQAMGRNTQGDPLLTLTDALDDEEQPQLRQQGFKTYLQNEFLTHCWQKLKLGFFEKGRTDTDPDARNAHLNIPTGHDCYYLVFSTTNTLPKPTKKQQGPWTDTAAAVINRWGNRLAVPIQWLLNNLGMTQLNAHWFGAYAKTTSPA